MSVMGTGIAAAVAQTHQTAREQKKIDTKRQREEERRGRAVREAYEVHLQSLEEGEGTGARLHADGQLDDEHDPARRIELIRRYREALAEARGAVAPTNEASPPDDGPRHPEDRQASTGSDPTPHLDVEA